MAYGWFVYSTTTEGLLDSFKISKNSNSPRWTDNINVALQYESADAAFTAIEDLEIKNAIPMEIVIPEFKRKKHSDYNYEWETLNKDRHDADYAFGKNRDV